MSHYHNKLKGFISLYRSLMDHPDYFEQKFDRIRAWIDILLMANYKQSKERERGHRMQIQRGQWPVSKRQLMLRWQWSLNKVRQFLHELEEDGQVKQQNTNRLTIITVLNYDVYQIPEGNKTQKTSNAPRKKNFAQKSAKKATTAERQTGRQKKRHNASPVKSLPKLKIQIGTAHGNSEGTAEGMANGMANSTAKPHKKPAKKNIKKERQKIAGNKPPKRVSLKMASKNGTAESMAESSPDLSQINTAGGTANSTANGPLLNNSNNLVNNKTPKSPLQGTGERKKNGRKEGVEKARMLAGEMAKMWNKCFPGCPADLEHNLKDFCKSAAYVARREELNAPIGDLQPQILTIWPLLLGEVANDPFYAGKTLRTISNNIENFYNKIHQNEKGTGDYNHQSGGRKITRKQSDPEDRTEAIRTW